MEIQNNDLTQLLERQFDSLNYRLNILESSSNPTDSIKTIIKETKELINDCSSSKVLEGINLKARAKKYKKNNSKKISDNNCLLISEIQNKVYLPYTVSQLKEIQKNNKNYKNLQDVINNEFVFSLDKYKNPVKSRFREAYNLMRKRENSSVFDSIDLALELSFNSFLNPAIISACKNLDELDVYLDYLSSNEVNKFHIFEVKYEFLPRTI